MGWIVKGYCHSTTAGAFAALRENPTDLTSVGVINSSGMVTEWWHYPASVDASGIVSFYSSYRDPSGLMNTNFYIEYPLPTCSTEMHEQFMPWANSGGAGFGLDVELMQLGFGGMLLLWSAGLGVGLVVSQVRKLRNS